MEQTHQTVMKDALQVEEYVHSLSRRRQSADFYEGGVRNVGHCDCCLCSLYIFSVSVISPHL